MINSQQLQCGIANCSSLNFLHVVLSDGNMDSAGAKPCAALPGTTFVVENLFYNSITRKKASPLPACIVWNFYHAFAGYSTSHCNPQMHEYCSGLTRCSKLLLMAVRGSTSLQGFSAICRHSEIAARSTAASWTCSASMQFSRQGLGYHARNR